MISSLILIVSGIVSGAYSQNILWDRYQSTTPPSNLPIKNANWSTSASGQVILLMPFTSYADLGILGDANSNHPSYYPEPISTAQLQTDDHPIISLFPQNIDATYQAILSYSATNNITPKFKTVPLNLNYHEYVTEVNQACNNNQSGSFDIIWVDATSAGALGNCLINLWEYDTSLSTGHSQGMIANNIYQNSYVAAPFESSTGIYFYNKDIFSRTGNHDGPGFGNMVELEMLLSNVLEIDRSINQEFSSIGMVMDFSNTQPFMSAFTELLAGTDYSSVFNQYGNDTTIASNGTINVIQRLMSWIESGITQLPKKDDYDLPIPYYHAFTEGNVAMMRQWSTWNTSEIGFNWGYTTISLSSPSIPSQSMASNNGWSLGVYKHSKNPDAAVKLIKYMTSQAFQKSLITSAATPMQPTYPNLYNDPAVCDVLGQELCKALYQSSIINRPATPSKDMYGAISQLIQSNITALISGQGKIVDSLHALATNIRSILGVHRLNNSTESIGLEAPITSGKKIPTNVTMQYSTLVGIVAITGLGFLFYKKRALILSHLHDPNQFQRLEEMQQTSPASANQRLTV